MIFSLKFQNFKFQSQRFICHFQFQLQYFICIIFNFSSSLAKFQLTSYDCIIKMMSWQSITCIQNFPSSLVLILDHYLKRTEIALTQAIHTKDSLALWFGWLTFTHLGRVMHLCISKQGHHWSDNGLLPTQHQAVIWTNEGLLLVGPLETIFSEIWINKTFFLQ